MNKKILLISNKNIKNLEVSLLIILFSILYRVFLPWGDEPDFWIKSQFYNFFYTTDILNNKIEENCINNYKIESIYAIIDLKTCFFPLLDLKAFIQQITIIIVVLLLLISLILLIDYKSKIYYKLDDRNLSWASNILLALLFPGMLYYLILISNEQISLILSLILLLFLKSIIAILILLSIIYIDFGNGLIVSIFYIIFNIFEVIKPRLSKKFIVVSILIFGFIYLNRANIFYFTTLLTDSEDITRFYKYFYVENSKYEEYINKYPLIIRFLNTFLTMVFMTPSGLKNPFVLIIIGLVILHLLTSLYKLIINLNNINIVMIKNFELQSLNGKTIKNGLLSAIYTILLCIILLPTHSNAKYYIFMLPFFYFIFILKYGELKCYFFSILLNLLILIWIIYSYK